MNEFFARHQKIAFQFSGGRDSTAALYLLRSFWDRFQVYHVDVGDQFPETRAVVDRVAQDVPVIRVEGRVKDVRAQHGWPSDAVPVDNLSMGQLVSGRELRLQSRYDCCARALMIPMHQRMVADGITGLIRGQRDAEYVTPPHRSGDHAEGFEFLYPIQEWTSAEVMAYLAEHDLPVAPFYERGMSRAPECMGCTAWWDEGRLTYMAEHHPKEARIALHRVNLVRREVARQIGMLEADMSGAIQTILPGDDDVRA